MESHLPTFRVMKSYTASASDMKTLRQKLDGDEIFKRKPFDVDANAEGCGEEVLGQEEIKTFHEGDPSLSQGGLPCPVHLKNSTGSTMDGTDEDFVGGEPAEDRRMEHEECVPNHPTRSNRLLPNSNEDEKGTPFPPSWSSSCSSEEIVFRGRANRRQAISLETTSKGLSGLSGTRNNDTPCLEHRSNVKLLNLLDDLLLSLDDRQKSNDSGDIRHLISSRLAPSPSEVLKTKQDKPYRGIDLNEGWNRATFRKIPKHFANAPRIPLVRIRPEFAAFYPKARKSLLQVRRGVQKLFTVVFKSTGLVPQPFHTCRSRVLSRPTTPSAAICRPEVVRRCNDPYLHRSGLMVRHLYQFDHYSPEVITGVLRATPWIGNADHKRSAREARLSKNYLSEKRQCLHLGGQVIHLQNPYLAPRAKRNRLVLNDEWRRRMRSRAIKAGRWADGTVRQGRLWAEFHWVLNGDVKDDPLLQKRAYVVKYFATKEPIVLEEGDKFGGTSRGSWRASY